MKLAARDLPRLMARPDPKMPGLLLYGADPMRVALKRKDLVAALVGPEAEAEMRLMRLSAADLRKDAAALDEALRAQGFFPGPRLVLAEDVTDGLAEMMGRALADWRPGDAWLVATAGALPAKSALRKLFEGHGTAAAVALYDDPPTPAEIEAELARAGLGAPAPAAMADLMALARAIDPGDFRQTVQKISLYKWGDTTALTPAEVALCAPATLDAEVDDVVHAAAEGQRDRVAALMRRLEAQGVSPVTLCIGALRHFRALYALAVDPAGAATAIGRLRPPVVGPRRDRMLRQAQGWSVAALEAAIDDIVDTDLTLRSASRAPGLPLIERTLLRTAGRLSRS